MPFVRRRPTDDEIARLEAASYAALDATLAAGTESESAFRSQFKTLRAPPRKPPPDAADAADAAAALAADALAVDAARREVDAAAERIYRASVGTIAAPDEAVEDASERATSGGRLSLPGDAAAPDMLTDNFTAGDDGDDDGDDAPPVLPESSDDEPDAPGAAAEPKAPPASTPRRLLGRARARRPSPGSAPPPPPPPGPTRPAAALAAALPEFLPPPPPRAAGDVTSDPVEPFRLDEGFDYDNAVLSAPKPSVEEQIRAWERDRDAAGMPAPPPAADDDDDDDEDEDEDEEYVLVDEEPRDFD